MAPSSGVLEYGKTHSVQRLIRSGSQMRPVAIRSPRLIVGYMKKTPIPVS